jgi:hypothetical protein
LLEEAAPVFQPANDVCHAGVLFLVPALLSQGLLKATAIYQPLRKGYYGLISILLTLAFMFLSRIKCPEQLKTCKVGELGKLLGLDRVPEAKCLRYKIEQIVTQQKAAVFNQALSQEWIDKEAPLFFYVDGHVRVYHGDLAHLPKRYVSREKLCLAGTTEFWVNNELGMPYLVVTGELNEKLKHVILTQIIPALLRDTASQVNQEMLDRNPLQARFSLVFDREAYDVPFFKLLWDTHRIAVVTYRKAVKDLWPASDFIDSQTTVIAKTLPMKLCEKPLTLHELEMREIRRLSDNGHQTSIVTTAKNFSMEALAGKMFSRWSQENFFRYMVQNYDLDRMAEYGIEEVNPEKRVVNPSYKKLCYRIKKLREKVARLKARLFTNIESNLTGNLDTVKDGLDHQALLLENVAKYDSEIQCLVGERQHTPEHIQIKDMPATEKFNKLKTESKLFMNTLRMIVYRAETVVANLIAPFYEKSADEIRMVVKEIIYSDADIVPDYTAKILTIRLHALSTPRANTAAKELCSILNETETLYPGTELRLLYEIV